MTSPAARLAKSACAASVSSSAAAARSALSRRACDAACRAASFSSAALFRASLAAALLSASSAASRCCLSSKSSAGLLCFSTFVLLSRLTMSLTRACTTVERTSPFLWKPICPVAMSPVFRRLPHIVYTIVTSLSLQPSIELSFVSCAHSWMIAAGTSAIVSSRGSRRYTCALECLSTWNHRSSGQPYG